MEEEFLLSFINLDDFCVSNIKNGYKNIVSIIQSEEDKTKTWKKMIVCYSMHDYTNFKVIFPSITNDRIDEDIVFGPLVTNDIYSYDIVYLSSPVRNNINVRNLDIIKKYYNHYNNILNVYKVLVFDNQFDVPSEKISEVIEGKPHKVYENNNLKKLVKKIN